MTKEDIERGLKSGRKLRCDRKDEPLLPWLLSHPNIDNKHVQADDQYSYIEFWWRAPRDGQEGKDGGGNETLGR